ncbi:MAG: hypothetical protein ACK5AZ_09470 [Bryobacteraceae bacterium]
MTGHASRPGGPGAAGRPTVRPEGAAGRPDGARHEQRGSGRRMDRGGAHGSGHGSMGPAIADLSERNPRLAERLQALVPGQTLEEASQGFRNFGQFVATANVANNLGIPFDDLASSVRSGNSLGAAVRELRPDANVKAEVRRAEREAKREIRAPGR